MTNILSGPASHNMNRTAYGGGKATSQSMLALQQYGTARSKNRLGPSANLLPPRSQNETRTNFSQQKMQNRSTDNIH